MVRINIINPKNLTDQHLIAEYNEILMLFGHVKKYPYINSKPKQYCLGKGHISFFKDKLKYLKKRHELIKEEMKKRNFLTNKIIDISIYNRKLCNSWRPCETDLVIIKKRLIEKIKLKPVFYTYYRKNKKIGFLVKLIKQAKIP